MNRAKREQLKHHTQKEIDEMEARDKARRKEDAKNYPELFYFMLDSIVEYEDRQRGFSTLSTECRENIKRRIDQGEYPDHLKPLAIAELKLKER